MSEQFWLSDAQWAVIQPFRASAASRTLLVSHKDVPSYECLLPWQAARHQERADADAATKRPTSPSRTMVPAASSRSEAKRTS